MQAMTVDVLMVDGTEHEDVTIILADQIAFSTTRQRHKWPTMQDDPVLSVSFMAFMSMKRQGMFTGSWDDFTAQVAMVAAEDMDDENGMNPTPPATPLG